MSSVHHTTPADGTFSPGGAVAWDAAHLLSGVASQASLDAVSNAVSIVSQALSAHALSSHVDVSISTPLSTHVIKWNSAAGEWQNAPDATAGGGGSVTSAELLAADNVVSAQAASALSQALSVNSVEHAGLSVRADSIANAVSIVSNALSNEISNRISHVNVVSANLASVNSDIRSVVSQLNSVVSQGLSTMSNRISVVSNAVSIVSTAASNALSVANAASQAASVVSNAASNALSVANAASQAASVVSNELSNVRSILSQRISALSLDNIKDVSLSTPILSTHVVKWNSLQAQWTNQADATAGGGGSVTSTEVSAGDESVRNLVSVLSQATSVADAALSVRADSLANAISIVSNAVSIVSNAVSIVSTAASNALSVANAASNAASIVSARVASLVSTDLSVHSQQLSVHSQQLSVHSQQLSVHSQQLSVLSGKVSAGIGISAQMRVRDAAVFTVSTTGLTNITSLSVSVEAGGMYILEAQLMISHSALNAYGIGMTYPGPVQAAGLWFGNVSILTADGFAGVFSATVMGAATHANAQTGVILLSGIAGSSAIPYNHNYRGVFHCSTAGVIQLQARVSLAGTPCIIHRGSYLKAYRIV